MGVGRGREVITVKGISQVGVRGFGGCRVEDVGGCGFSCYTGVCIAAAGVVGVVAGIKEVGGGL